MRNVILSTVSNPSAEFVNLNSMMNLLDINSYYKVTEPLSRVKINNLFARSVVEKQVTGHSYVDRFSDPETFYVVHPYGMSLLFGETANKEFNNHLVDYLLNSTGSRNKIEWLQAWPGEWNTLLTDVLGDKLIIPNDDRAEPKSSLVEVNTRVNFKFNAEKYHDFKTSLKTCDHKIIPVNRENFDRMQGNVVPQYFWDNADDFCSKGAGFSLVIDGKPVSTAYAAYVIENRLELGIETLAEHRGKGFALFTCSALIDFCLENSFEPVWSCRQENSASYKLALKLGFEPVLTLPYYRLPV